MDPSAVIPPSVLPPYIRPLSQSLSVDDWTYLRRKGALEVPDPATRDAILVSYFATVYPFMPVLRLDRFLNAITTDGRSGQISLLLFQAIMFAGLSAMDPTRIQELSFRDVKHARRIFFARARTLHDLDAETESEPVL